MRSYDNALARRMLLLNQMAGPLFRELAEDLAQALPEGCDLLTGHPDTLAVGSEVPKLRIKSAPIYNRRNKFSRAFSWINYSAVAVGQLLRVRKGTAVLFVSNPPLLGPLAMLVCGLRNIPYIVLVYDLYPDALVEFGGLRSNSWITRLWQFVNKSVWNRSAAVFTLGPVIAERLSRQFSPELTRLGKVGVVPPWADIHKIRPLKKAENPLAGRLGQLDCVTVLYSGNMGISHDIESILGAAKILENRDDIKFLLIGEGAKWQLAIDYVEKEASKNMLVLPFQPEEMLPFTMVLGDISLVSLKKGAEGLMVPSKMYYYMAAGSALLGICHGTNDLEHTIRMAQCGRVVEPGSADQLADTIVALADDPVLLASFRKNARRESELNYSREVCADSLICALRSIAIIEND